MIISKPLAAIIGGLFFAAILGFIPAACDASAQSADYSMLNHEQGQTKLSPHPDYRCHLCRRLGRCHRLYDRPRRMSKTIKQGYADAAYADAALRDPC